MNVKTKHNPIGLHAATLRVGSDCYPFEVIAVNGNRVNVRRVDAIWNKEIEDYEYFSCPDLFNVEVFSKRKNGKYYKVGQTMNSCSLNIGRMRFYQDPCF